MQGRDPEDIIKEEGATQATFKKLYKSSNDPWFTKGSQAERIRLEITHKHINNCLKELTKIHEKAGISEPIRVLDFACGNLTWSFGPGVELVSYDWAKDNRSISSINGQFDIVLALNVMAYYKFTGRMNLRSSLKHRLKSYGYYIESNPVANQSIVLPFEDMLREIESLRYTVVATEALAFDWKEDRAFRDSAAYRVKMLEGNYPICDVTQRIVVGVNS